MFCDSDWGGGEERRSTSGGVVYYGGVQMLTWSRTQSHIALSSCEAEVVALSVATQEGEYVKTLLEELKVKPSLAVRCDSSSARVLVMRKGSRSFEARLCASPLVARRN